MPSASAHAILVSSKPANGAVVPRSPGQVVLRFNEPVETAFGSVRVYDADARRIDAGHTVRPAGDEVAVGVGGLARGTYTVAWRVISADTHPVHGAFTFSVGAASGDPRAVAAKVLEGEATPRYVSVLFGAVRFLDFALILLAAGGVGVLVFVARDGARRVRRGIAAATAAAAALLLPVVLLGLALEGAEAGGFSLGSSFRPSVLRGVLETQFGQVWLARACVAALLAIVVLALPRLLRLGSALAVALGLALVASPTAAAHAATGSGLAWVADGTHVLAASVWTGGLALTGLALLLAREERWSLATRAVPRISAAAVGSVGLLLAGGIVGAYLEVRAWRGLWETTYGGLLLAKIGLLLPLLAIGAYNNRFAVPRLRAGIASVIEQRRFLRMVAVELAIVVAILGVTAALVEQPSAKSAVARTGPFATEGKIGPLDLNLVVDPAKAGSNAIHLYLLDRSGLPASVAEARLDASLPAAGITSLRLRTEHAGPGHFVVPSAQLAIAGDWRLRVLVRRGEFDEWLTTLTIPIRKD